MVGYVAVGGFELVDGLVDFGGGATGEDEVRGGLRGLLGLVLLFLVLGCGVMG